MCSATGLAQWPQAGREPVAHEKQPARRHRRAVGGMGTRLDRVDGALSPRALGCVSNCGKHTLT